VTTETRNVMPLSVTNDSSTGTTSHDDVLPNTTYGQIGNRNDGDDDDDHEMR